MARTGGRSQGMPGAGRRAGRRAGTAALARELSIRLERFVRQRRLAEQCQSG